MLLPLYHAVIELYTMAFENTFISQLYVVTHVTSPLLTLHRYSRYNFGTSFVIKPWHVCSSYCFFHIRHKEYEENFHWHIFSGREYEEIKLFHFFRYSRYICLSSRMAYFLPIHGNGGQIFLFGKSKLMSYTF